MKRMILIPEERLLRYEERNKQRIENTYNDLPEGVMYGGGKIQRKYWKIPYRPK